VKQIVFHPEAEADIIEAAQYYEGNIPGLGSDFLGELEKELDQITEKPEAPSSQLNVR
jgi:toxin ParE1/3/4